MGRFICMTCIIAWIVTYHSYNTLLIYSTFSSIYLFLSSLPLCVLLRAEREGGYGEHGSIWHSFTFILSDHWCTKHHVLYLSFILPRLYLSFISAPIQPVLSGGSLTALSTAPWPFLGRLFALSWEEGTAIQAVKSQSLLFYKPCLPPLFLFFQLKHIKVSTELTSLKMKESKSIDPVSSSDSFHSHFQWWLAGKHHDHLFLSSSDLIHSCLNSVLS